jgi:hypothetical protein
VFAGLYHLAPEVLDAVKILKPETIIRWRAGFRAWWDEGKIIGYAFAYEQARHHRRPPAATPPLNR